MLRPAGTRKRSAGRSPAATRRATSCAGSEAQVPAYRGGRPDASCTLRDSLSSSGVQKHG